VAGQARRSDRWSGWNACADKAFARVFIVVFVFLQDFRSTLIPAIAVPVAILGFFMRACLGHYINLLTLFIHQFTLIPWVLLVIGYDAIVVVGGTAQVDAKFGAEPIHCRGHARNYRRHYLITGDGRGILPVVACSAQPGSLNLAFTASIAIVISAVNALTSPALASFILKEQRRWG